MNIYITLTLICASALCLQNSSDSFRKHYGLSFERCPEFIKSFRCMSACKSIGFQIFRLDRKCRCTCHEMKTTTILPFFKWRTNGTTGTSPKTFSPGLYHIVGTLSPATEWAPPVPTTEAASCVYLTTRNTTDTDAAGNSTGTETETGDTATTVVTVGGANDAGGPTVAGNTGSPTVASSVASSDSGGAGDPPPPARK